MTDATPLNRTLLFESPLLFKAGAQFDYAVKDPSIFATRKISSTVLPQIGKHMMIRNLDELKRLPAIESVMQRTPKTPFTTHAVFPDELSSPDVDPLSTDGEDEYLPPLEDHDDWEETLRWDDHQRTTRGAPSTAGVPQMSSAGAGNDVGAVSTLWSWPIEVLYQQYHVVVALDMGKGAFEISRNGCVYVDRMPSAVEAILCAVDATLAARRTEVEGIRAWMEAHVPESMHPFINDMVWDPTIVISVVLVNTPLRASAMLQRHERGKHSSDHHTSAVDEEEGVTVVEDMSAGRAAPPGPNRKSSVPTGTLGSSPPVGHQGASTTAQLGVVPSVPPAKPPTSSPSFNGAQVPFIELNATPFGLLDDSSDYSVEKAVPIVVQRKAEDVIADSTFMPRLRHVLQSFENMHRTELQEASDQEWPDVNIDETIERTLRFVPFDNDACHSVAIVSNFAVCGCSETIALQESQILRKNVILGCMSLKRFIPWDSPHLTPLGHLLIASGGFGVHVDQWTELSDVSLTHEWCRRFEGSRCLAQQMFVHLISKFPVLAPSISQRLDNIIPNIRALPYLIEVPLDIFNDVKGGGGGNGRGGAGAASDLVISTSSELQALRVLAEARINEGWSVVVDYGSKTTAPHLYARLDHFLHKGSLTVFYEVDIIMPLLYRRARVQGTPALVRQFVNIRLDERLCTNDMSEPGRSWHTYLGLLRGMLDGWMRADEEALALYVPATCGAGANASVALAASIAAASRLPGCTAEWLNRCSVNSAIVALVTKSPCGRLLSEGQSAVAHDRHHMGMSKSLLKRPADALLAFLRDWAVQSLSGCGFSTLQDGPACVSPAAYNSRHVIMRRTVVPADDTLQWFDIVQVFVIDESNSGGELVAGTIEVRFNFFHRAAATQAAVMEEVMKALTSYSGVREGQSVACHVLSLQSSCVARRAMCMGKHELLSRWSDQSAASSGPSTSSRSGSLVRSGSSKRTGRHGNNKKTVQTAAVRIFVLGAHGSELILMRGTASTRWSFGFFVARLTPVLALSAMTLLALRREAIGFLLMHAHVGGRRMLLWKRHALTVRGQRLAVDVHDVLEMEVGDGRVDVRVVRHMSHYDDLSDSMRVALHEDIAKDHRILGALVTLQAALMVKLHGEASIHPRHLTADPLSATRLDPLMAVNGGACEVEPSLGALVPLLRGANFRFMEFAAPPCTGATGAWEVERGMFHMVSVAGDETIAVPARASLHPSILSMLFGGSGAAPCPSSPPPPLAEEEHMAQISRLSPRHGAVGVLTILIAICPTNHRPVAGGLLPNEQRTRVLIGSLDMSSATHALCSELSVTPPSDVVDASGIRVHVQAGVITEDAALMSSIEAVFAAFAAALHTRSLQRELLVRCRRAEQRPSAPTTPTFAPLCAAESQFQRIDIANTASSSDLTAYTASYSEMESYFSLMMSYVSTLDLSFMARMELRGLLDAGATQRIVSEAVSKHHMVLRQIPSTQPDENDPAFLFDAHFARPVNASEQSEAEVSWDGSYSSRDSGGVVKDMGAIEPEQVACLVKLLLHWQYEDGGADEVQWVGGSTSSPAPTPKHGRDTRNLPPAATTQRPVRKLSLVFVSLTLPDAFFDLCRNRFRPPAHVVRRMIMETIANNGIVPVEGAAAKASADFGRPTTHTAGKMFFTPVCTGKDACAMQAESIPLSRLPEVCFTKLEQVLDGLAKYVADAALHRCVRSKLFEAVHNALRASDMTVEQEEGDASQRMESSTGTAPAEAAVSVSSIPSIGKAPPAAPSYILHPNEAVIEDIKRIPQLLDVCAEVLVPAFACTKQAYQREEFSVEFTRSVRHGDAVDPLAATHQVFSQVLIDEGVCMLPITTLSYLLIPAAWAHSDELLLVSLERRNSIHVDMVRVLCYTPHGSPFAVQAACSEVRKQITQKVAQVSQIHLLKELRERERAPDELVPPFWGDQFLPAPVEPHQLEAGRKNATFMLNGQTIAEIPVYYKLQHQAKTVLAKIANQGHKMQLYRIYDREQCFVVLDDHVDATFHVIRLVFVKNGTLPPSPMQFPPLLNDKSDVCSMLVVQVYSAYPNPRVTHVLERLQDFCYLLAVQELQTRLKISMEKDLHTHDWTFLRYEKRGQLVVQMVAGGQPWHPAIRDLAKWFLLRNMHECKFRLFATREALLHINLPSSSFLSHYQLHRGGESMADVAASNDGTMGSLDGTDGGGDASVASMPSLEELRFVKREEGPTEVLLSCGIQFHVDANRITVDVYSTKVPNARSVALLDTIAAANKALQQCLADTVLHVDFFLASQRTTPQASYTPKIRPLHVKNALALADKLIDMSQSIAVSELSTLRKRSYDLRHVNVVHVGGLVERLSGLLEPFGPHVLVSNGRDNAVLAGFPWRWMESVQNKLTIDDDHFFVLCGFQMVEDRATGDDPAPRPANDSNLEPLSYAPVHTTRVHAATHPLFHITTATCVETIRGSLEGNEPATTDLCALYDKSKLIIHVNLREGVEAVVFNLRDSETILDLIGCVLQETSKKSALHRDVLLQSLGYEVHSAFNEQDLARMCCGDKRNVQEPQPLNVVGEVLHRSAVMTRFPKQIPPTVPSPRKGPPPSPLAEVDGDDAVVPINKAEAFSTIVVGLANRGTMVNHVFPFDGAVKVLYDDGAIWTVAQCRRAVEQLIDDQVFEADASPLFGLQLDTASHTFTYVRGAGRGLHNYRVAPYYGAVIPVNVLVASVYHRHLQRAHILIEAKNARSQVSEGIAKFERCWATKGPTASATLVRHIIQLQLKSKQVKGLRVPDFSLRNEALSPDDLILEQRVPAMTTEIQRMYCRRVDHVLRQYVDYLIGIFGTSIYVVDVDPSVPEFLNDPDIAKRLCCRYGQVQDPSSDKGYIKFSPHLYFIVMTVPDAIAALRAHRRSSNSGVMAALHDAVPKLLLPNNEAGSHRGSSLLQGFFVVEVGFQVVNYALDYFVIGHNASAHTADVNLAATLLKQRFLFSSVVYDLGVNRLIQQARQSSPPLGGEQPLAVAVRNLVKYYPNPPGYSVNYVHSFPITDAAILGLRRLLTQDSKSYAGNGDRPMAHIVAPHASFLRRESTQDLYHVVGVLSWEEKPKLYVILATERETPSCPRALHRQDMHPVLAEARALLTQQLLDSTVHLRVQDLWDTLRAPPAHATSPNGAAAPLPFKAADYHLLRAHAYAVSYQSRVDACLFDGTSNKRTTLLRWSDLEKQLPISSYHNEATRCNVRSVTLSENQHVLMATLSTGSPRDLRVGAVLTCTSDLAEVEHGGEGGGCVIDMECIRHHETAFNHDGFGVNSTIDETTAEGHALAVEVTLVDALLRVVVSAIWNSMS